MIEDHSFKYNIAPNTFYDVDGDGLTLSLDFALMTPAAFVAPDTLTFSSASSNLTMDVRNSYSGL